MMLCKRTTVSAGAARRTAVVVRAESVGSSSSSSSSGRRAALVAFAGTALAAAAAAPAALARDYKEALAAKEARRAKLRDTAAERKATGKDAQAFKDSDYQVGEESTTPQGRSRQNEGARTQVNV